MTDEVVVNGVRVGPSTDLPSLLRRQITDGNVLAGKYDDSPEPGIWSLFAAAKGTRLEPRLVEAVQSLLTDSDPSIRSAAVGLAQAYAEKFQAPDLLRVLADHPNLFEGVTGRLDEPDLTRQQQPRLGNRSCARIDWRPACSSSPYPVPTQEPGAARTTG